MESLTARQQEILNLIKEFIQETGYPPTRSEIAATLGFRSPNAAEQHLRALAKKGVIELQSGASRGIRLTEEQGLPVVGQVAAGSPLLAEQHIDRHVQLPINLFSPKADYLLKVRGMSMKDVGIMDGDLLAVHKTTEARNGQIVVARIADEVTVKRLQRHRQRVQLLPENEDFEPIQVDLRHETLIIEGIGVGVLRPEL